MKVCVFDAYGTLFDVAAAARDYASTLPDSDPLTREWTALAETWRVKQLEYTWLRAASDQHSDFWSVTKDALDFALEAHRVPAEAHQDGLLQLYRRLGPYPEAGAALRRLREAGTPCAILSNGEPGMLAAAVENAGFSDMLAAVISVEEVGAFKPSPKVYALATERFRCDRGDVLFFSSNGWDVCSAAAYGFRTIWVNRRQAPVDRLGARPDHIVGDLSQAVEVALS